MTRPPFGLQYRKCTNEELLHFLRVRTGNLRRRPNRHTCIRKLKELDLEVTFRFLDLAPELRNQVYEEVLHHNDEAKRISEASDRYSTRNFVRVPASTAYPALLRASRQIHKEARGILYDQSVLSAQLDLFGVEWAFPCNYARPDSYASSNAGASDSLANLKEAECLEEQESVGDSGVVEDAGIDEASATLGGADPDFSHTLDASDGTESSDDDASLTSSGESGMSEWKEQEQLAVIDAPNCLGPMRAFRNLTLLIRYQEFAESDGVLAKVAKALITTFDESNPLAILKFVNLCDFDLRPGVPRAFAPLCHLPAATRVEFVAFSKKLEKEIREVINRRAK